MAVKAAWSNDKAAPYSDDGKSSQLSSVGGSSYKTPLAKGRDSVADCCVGIFISWPCTCFWSYVLVLLLLSAASIAAGMMNIGEQDDAWKVWDGRATQDWEALDYATEIVDHPRRLLLPEELLQAGKNKSRKESWRRNRQSVGPALKRPQPPKRNRVQRADAIPMSIQLLDANTSGAPRQLQDERGDDDGRETFYLYYKAAGTVFNAGSLRAICEFEKHIGERNFHHSFTWQTPLSLFYGLPSTAPPAQRQLPAFSDLTCVELSETFIEATVTEMHNSVRGLFAASVYSKYVHPGFLDTGLSEMTSTKIEGEERFMEDLVEDAQDRLGQEYGFLVSAYQGDDDRFISLSGGTRVRFFFTGLNEFEEMIGPDFALAFFAFVFVFGIMWIYIGSFFFACFGMLQIVLSLPLSALLYRGLFQIKYFEFLHILVVYLVLGIGADDIFVLVDSFRHVDADMRGTKPWTEKGFREIFTVAYIRSTSAIFNTSFTTGVAFLASSGSEAMPMRTCGWYAAICILMCYFLTITFTPVLVVIWHTRFQGKCCCSLDWSKRQELSPEAVQAAKIEAGGGEEVALKSDGEGSTPKKGPVERALARTYIPFMSYGFDMACVSIRPGSICVVIIMLAVAVQGIAFASQLTPPRKAEEWFPDNHMANEWSDFTSDVTFSPDHENNAVVGVFWGIARLDTSSLDVYKPDDFKGGTVFDDSFDLSRVDAQEVVFRTCEKLRELRCTEKACKNNGYETPTLMMQASEKTWSCFLEDFRDYIIWRDGSQAWPLPQSQFNNELQLFRTDAASRSPSGCCDYGDALDEDYLEDIGFINGELKYVQIRIRTTVQWDTAFGEGVDVRDLLEDWIASDVRSGIPGMGSAKFHAQGLFASYDLGEELLQGLFQGCAIAAPIAFLVLLASTWNVVVSVYAVSCVGFIVLCVLGFCKSAMDWDLGIGEAIAGVIVLGYSVDYVVHLSHIYCEGGSEHGLYTRGDRAKFAIENMGSTVFAGAITTAGSALVMFFCFFYFFTKMAILITMTIVYAFLFSLGLLMGLLWTVGPQEDFGNLAACCCCCKRQSEGEAKVVPLDDAS